jgi:FG-GAP-like repeat
MMIAVRASGIAFAVAFAMLAAASRGATCIDFAPAVNYDAGAAPRFIVSADLNHDGKLDLVIANQNSRNVSVLIGNGGGTFAPAVNYAVDDTPLSVAIADVNGDGKPDLVVANYVSSNPSRKRRRHIRRGAERKHGHQSLSDRDGGPER